MKYFLEEYEHLVYENTEKHGARFEGLRQEFAQAKMANDDNKANKLRIELVDLNSELSGLGLGLRYKETSDLLPNVAVTTWLLIYATGFIAAIVIALISLAAYIFELYKEGRFDSSLTFLFSTFWGKIALTLAVSLVGYSLFLFKKKQQFSYGLLETSFAIANCYLLADNFQAMIAKHNDIANVLFSGMATLYLMVRGLSNISEGINKSPKLLALIKNNNPFSTNQALR